MLRYQVFLEHDRHTGHWTASVVGHPEIIADAESREAALRLIEEAIRFARHEGHLAGDSLRGPIDTGVASVDV